jgi:tetratricopeptide (TPR) repeat protein
MRTPRLSNSHCDSSDLRSDDWLSFSLATRQNITVYATDYRPEEHFAMRTLSSEAEQLKSNEYRPNKNGREIFGGLVPHGKLWRTGANAVTKIKFSDVVTLGSKEIPAGEYALFTIPTADEWTIIISKDATVQSWTDYKQENDAARFTAKPEPIPDTIETFTIELDDVKGPSATLNFLWDKTRVPVKLTTDDVEQVSKQLDAVVSARTPLDARTAYQAAAFYYDNNKDMKQAAKWIDQALEKNPDAYFMHYKKAQIQAKLGNKKEAIASAQKAIDILKKDKAPDESAIRNAQQIIDSSK